MQLFVVSLGIRMVVDANPAVERSPQKVVECGSEESLLPFERVQRRPYLEVAAELELERGHQFDFAESSASPISCLKVVSDFEAIVNLVVERAPANSSISFWMALRAKTAATLPVLCQSFSSARFPFNSAMHSR
jgi:hypothetical protein